MKKASIIVHQNYVEEVIKNLHETGLMEIIDISKEDPSILEDAERASTHPDSETCVTYELRLSRLIGILSRIKPKKGGIKAIFNPELPEIKKVEDHTLDDLYSYAEGVLGEIEKTILDKDEKLQEFNEMIGLINQDLDQLDYLKDFELDISDVGESDYLIVKVGKTSDIDGLKTGLKGLEKTVLFSRQFGSGKNIEWAVLIAGHISEKANIEKICREKISEFDFVDLKGSPKDLIKSLEKEKKDIANQKKKVIADLQIFAKNQLDDLLAIREEIQLERVRKEITKNFAKTNSTFIIKGWVLEKDEKQIKESIEKVSKKNIIADFEKPSPNPDKPPTYIKTPRWAEGFKGLVEMFSLPKYGEINPTIIMGIFFITFFGVMLGDAGYGLIILGLSLFGYIRLGKHSDLFRNWSFMGIWMGIITTIVGFLTNSLFGDLIPRFFYTYGPNDPIPALYSLNIAGIQLPANPIKDPISILVIALLFGLAHLNVGVILGIIQAFKSKKYREALTDKLCWIPLQLGGGMLIGLFLLDFQLSDTLFYIAAILVVIGLIQLFIAKGPIGFFSITGYVGDWLSYARLLALGLATAGMALAFNVVAQLLGEMIPVIGIVITIILIVFAHLINLGLQALGAGIHSLRLQYVEFFNRFYEGGGHEFSPFKIKRKYTKTEEGKK